MQTHFDTSRLERAMEEARGIEVTAVVVAMEKDNGQIIIHNIGFRDGRQRIYEAVKMSSKTFEDYNARLELKPREKDTDC